MRTKTETLQAGQRHKLPCDGRFFMLIEAASPVDLTFFVEGRGSIGDSALGIVGGFKFKSTAQLTFVEMTSAITQVVKYVYADGDVDYQRYQFSQVQATGGTHSTAVMTTGAVQILAADLSRRRVIMTAHPDNTGQIKIGFAGTVTAANAARRLDAGEAFVEELAAAAPLYALSDTAGDVLCIEVAQ